MCLRMWGVSTAHYSTASACHPTALRRSVQATTCVSGMSKCALSGPSTRLARTLADIAEDCFGNVEGCARARSLGGARAHLLESQGISQELSHRERDVLGQANTDRGAHGGKVVGITLFLARDRIDDDHRRCPPKHFGYSEAARLGDDHIGSHHQIVDVIDKAERSQLKCLASLQVAQLFRQPAIAASDDDQGAMQATAQQPLNHQTYMPAVNTPTEECHNGTIRRQLERCSCLRALFR